jgi:hypothetical protein
MVVILFHFFADTVKKLTGGTPSQPDSKGRSMCPKGVAQKSREIIHFPDNTPIPNNLQPKT